MKKLVITIIVLFSVHLNSYAQKQEGKDQDIKGTNPRGVNQVQQLCGANLVQALNERINGNSKHLGSFARYISEIALPNCNVSDLINRDENLRSNLGRLIQGAARGDNLTEPATENELNLVARLVENDQALRENFQNWRNARDNEVARRRVSCTPLDRRSELPPVRNQGSSGWCYAYVAADLLSLQSGENISPIELSLNTVHAANLRSLFNLGVEFTMNSPLGNMEATSLTPENPSARMQEILANQPSAHFGGWIKQAIQSSGFGGGYCLDNNLSSQSSWELDIMGAVGHVNNLRAQIEETEQQETRQSDLCATALVLHESLFRHLNPNEILRIIADPVHYDHFFELVKASCVERTPIETRITEENVRFNNAEELERMITPLLDEGKIVGFNYRARILTANVGEHDHHASSIVGRRWSDESLSCEYLVRNSWGTSCSGYYSHLDCEAGNIWVPSRDLVNSLNQITHLE